MVGKVEGQKFCERPGWYDVFELSQPALSLPCVRVDLYFLNHFWLVFFCNWKVRIQLKNWLWMLTFCPKRECWKISLIYWTKRMTLLPLPCLSLFPNFVRIYSLLCSFTKMVDESRKILFFVIQGDYYCQKLNI